MKTDAQIQSDILDEIKWDPELTATAPTIGVSVNNGIILLTGHVDSIRLRDIAAQAARRVPGTNFLVVNIDFPGTKPHNNNADCDLAREIKESFNLLSLPNNGELTIVIDNGWVSLEGVTEWEYQRKTMENYVRNLRDVKGVTNLIRVNDPSCDPETIVEEISAAFHRHATLDAAQIHAEVNDGKVTLSGTVRSWVEKKDAESVAWASQGISAVGNQIKVDATSLTQ